jgi:hypothetical protein
MGVNNGRFPAVVAEQCLSVLQIGSWGAGGCSPESTNRRMKNGKRDTNRRTEE